MNNEFTRAQARDLLADLLADDSDITQQTLFDAPRVYAAKPMPKWKVQGITLVYVNHTCNHCGAVHTHTSPRLLLNEVLMDADGSVMKVHQTSSPKCSDFHDMLFSSEAKTPVKVDDMSVDYQYIDGEDTDFCSECINEMSVADLQRMFVKQQERRIREAAGQRMERIAEAQAKVSSDKKANKVVNAIEELLSADAVDSSDDLDVVEGDEE